MTTSRLWPATAGPAAPTPYGGKFGAGIIFQCTGPKVQWLQGYYAWIPPGGDVTPETFALWAPSSPTAGTLVPGSYVTSGELTAGQWNYVPAPAPLPLSLALPYIAQRNWTAVNGFPDTGSSFGGGDPYASGLASGALFAYSDGTAGGTAGTANPFGGPQGLFTTASADASAAMCDEGSGSANFWTDVLVSDTAPAGYAGSYELFPHNFTGNPSAQLDLNVNYNVGVTFTLAAACPVLGIKMLSLPGAASLPTRASIFSVTDGGLGGAELYAITAPAWSGAAGSGMVTAEFASPPVLAPGTYRVSVYNANGTGGGWNAKDSETGAFGPGGPLAAGISNGPLSAPGTSAAPLCYDYGSNPAATPPYSAGTTEPGQCVFGQLPDGTMGVPYLYAGPSQNYFVSPVIGQPVATSGASLPMLAGARIM